MNSKYKDLEYLKDKLINGNELLPNVIGAEASAGKTTMASIGMVEAWKINGRKSHLITKERVECIEIAKKCNEIAGFEIAKAFISVKKDDDKEVFNKEIICGINELKEYPIIISTHARYIGSLEYIISDSPFKDKLRENEKIIKYIEYLKMEVINLVIDEQIDLIKNTYFSISIERLESLINSSKEYDGDNCYFKINSFIEPLIRYIKGYDLIKNKLYRCNLWIMLDNEIWYLEKQIRQMIYSLNVKNESLTGFNNDELEKIVQGVSLIYKNINEIGNGLAEVIIAKGENTTSIATYNHRMELMLVKNNFILDASSPFMSIYNSQRFLKIPTKRIIDHAESMFIVNKFNTSTSAYKNDVGNDKIKYILNDMINYNGDKLVISKDNYRKTFNDFGFENFETAKAKNKYKDFENVFITHTTRMELPYYIFCNDYYTKEIVEDISYVNDNISGGIKFENKAIQLIYEEYTADMMYQAIKRVQRNKKPKAKYVFYGSYIPSIHIVYKELLNIPKPKVEFLNEKFTVFNRIFEFMQNEWDGSKIYIKNLSLMFKCSSKAVSNALDKLEREFVLDSLGVDFGKNEKSFFIQSSRLLEERCNFYNKLDMLLIENKKIEKQNNKREVKKMDKLLKWLEDNEGKYILEKEINKFVKLVNLEKTDGTLQDKPKKINEYLSSLELNFTILNKPSHGNKRWLIESFE